MVESFVRYVKRLLVLVPGIIIAFFSVRDIFPFFDNKLPGALAVFVTYVLAAYVLVPVSIRALRFFHPAKHLPLYCVTPDGFASDPLNIGIIGTKAQLSRVMQRAGWEVADEHSLQNVLKEVVNTILGRPYPTAPMSNLYLFGRKQDVGFERYRTEGRGHRHHVRFWATTFQGDAPEKMSDIRWLPRKSIRSGKKYVWIGAASRDVGLSLIRHNAQMTHMIHPDTDAERDLIALQLLKAAPAEYVSDIRLERPYRLSNRALTGYLQTDGMMSIIRLK